MKECSICKEVKSLKEYYSYQKKKANGEEYVYIQPYCKKCTVKKTLSKRNENREENLQKMREYNSEYMKREGYKEERAKWRKRFNAAGKHKRWQQENPDKMKSYRQKREKKKKHKISNFEWENCKNYFNYRCGYCGLPIEDHRINFNGNTILGDFHKEHVDDNGENDLSNCVPACKTCNSQKWEHEFEEWYSMDNSIYSIERYKKIIKWLNEDYKLYIEKNKTSKT